MLVKYKLLLVLQNKQYFYQHLIIIKYFYIFHLYATNELYYIPNLKLLKCKAKTSFSLHFNNNTITQTMT